MILHIIVGANGSDKTILQSITFKCIGDVDE